MTTKPADGTRFHKGEKVEAAVDLPGVPEGTPGKVIIEDGLRRFRYWVRFDNGVSMGSLTPEKLRRPEHHHLAL